MVSVTGLLVVALVLAPIAPSLAGAVPVPATGADRSAATRPSTAPSGLPASAPARPVASDRNTTEYLALDRSLETSRFGVATLDVGGSVSADGARTRSAYQTSWLREAFAAAGDNDTERRAVVLDGADRIDARIATLERRSDTALTRYNAGEITTQAYLRELAAISQAADSLRGAVSLLATYNSAAGQPVATERIATQKSRLLLLDGPVRDKLAAAMRGERDPIRVHVETTDEGVVLATIDRRGFTRRYVREASVPSARRPDGTDQFEATNDRIGAARDRFRELYPWTWSNRESTSIVAYQGEPFLYTASVYSVRVGHAHGTSRTYDLIAFLDGATRDVFREIQYKDLSRVPTIAADSNQSDGVRVSVNRTRSGGPMLVAATDEASGDPLIATVLIDGEPVGRTGTNGHRWVVAPRPTANVTVVRGDASASVTVFSDGAPTG
ncbi:hypothetical protein BRC89_13715 [Halobacteriales archaeon QS_4_70_19]|nr:MAG: hypothetical protein BRC89_13715 [Halobacteriales archaeon QS_4_70_19]